MPEKRHWTAEEYLAFERESEEKHEFVDGQVSLTAGASHNHNLIVSNLIYALGIQIRPTPYEIYASLMRLRVQKNYVYPDVLVVAHKPLLEDQYQDTLLNPTVIIEVLSPSTEQYDRGKKFHNYRTLDSLQEYLLISQNTQRIEHYLRQQNNAWLSQTQPM